MSKQGRSNSSAQNENPPDALDSTIPPAVEAKLREIGRFLASPAIARRVWERLLTDQQRSALGNDLVLACGGGSKTLELWLRFHPAWRPRGIARLARQVDLLSSSDFHWIDRSLAPLDPTLSQASRDASVDGDEDLEERVADAIAKHQLVLVQGEGLRRAYWRSSLLPVNWLKYSAIWELFWLLTKNAKRRQAVGWDQLSSRESENAIVDRRSRLKKWIPRDLDCLIKANRYSYRLELPSTQVEVIEAQPEDWMVER